MLTHHDDRYMASPAFMQTKAVRQIEYATQDIVDTQRQVCMDAKDLEALELAIAELLRVVAVEKQRIR